MAKLITQRYKLYLTIIESSKGTEKIGLWHKLAWAQIAI